jgi:hypothetical protein
MIQIAMALFVFFAGTPFAFAGSLHDAARDGDLEKARVLIDEGAVIDSQSERGETPLTLAILAGQGKVVEFLVDKGAAIDGLMPAASRPCTRRPTPATRRSPSC